ncbi:MAG: cysteine rich repeat-containing protein [Pseudomonadota bacterium]
MFSKSLITATLFSIASFGCAHAEEILKQCGGDIVQYCSSVTPGDGRIGACLYAHTDRLSEPCFTATGPMATMLEVYFDNLSKMQEFCSVDIENHCSDSHLGHGKVVMCLVDRADEISPACNEQITKLRGVIELNFMSVK